MNLLLWWVARCQMELQVLESRCHEMKSLLLQIGPGLNANETQIHYDKHHKLSSLVKVTKTQTILSNFE